MAQRKIIWTRKAQSERKQILEYWIERNKSKTYSIKLNRLIKDTLKQLAKNPHIGRPSDFENVRAKIAGDYLVFYSYNEKELIVMSLWDSRRDEQTLTVT